MPRKILVVDDDRSLCDLITDLLAGEGYAVSCAPDGLEALAAVERDPPDLIVTDVHMPRLDGRGLVARLAERRLGIPVILMSAAPRPPERLGAAFVAKPFHLDHLVAAVGRTLAAAEA